MSMQAQAVYNLIEETGVVAVMRGAFPPKVALQVCETLIGEGIKSFEFTMNSEQPIEAMQAVKKAFGADASVGMGTVLDVESAQRVIDADADFVVSPAFQPDVVAHVLKQDVFMAPGVITPSEALAAWNMGVKLLKIFPIGALGVDYFKAVFGPFNHMKFMCNGAVNAENIREFMQAGAIAGGMGSWLTGDGTWPESKIRSRARVLLNSIAVARGERPMQEV